MPLAETARLAAELSLKGNFAGQLKGAERALGGFDTKLSQTQGRAYKAGQQIGTGIQNAAKIAAVGVGLLASQVAFGLRSLSGLEDVVAQTNAVLKSTSGVSGETAASVRALANNYEQLNATIDDTIIQSGENLLLTFTNIRKNAFEPALKAALDMNVALGKGPDGLTDTVRILGKALNDPQKGLTALQRIGITFTAGQKAQITAALKANDTFKAQGIILAELNKRFGGSFIAGGQTTKGKIALFGDAIDDLQRALATALLPAINKVSVALTHFLADPKVIAGVTQLGDKIGSLFSNQNLTAGAGVLKGLFDTAQRMAPAVEAAASTIGKVVGVAVSAFKALPPELQTLLVAGLAVNKLTGGLVTNIAGGLIGAILGQLKSSVVGITAGVVNVNGGIGGGAGDLIGKAAGGAGLAGLGIGVGTVAVLAIAPAALIGLSLAIVKASDPTGAQALAGKAATAAARGIHDDNNKALIALQKIQANTAATAGKLADDIAKAIQTSSTADQPGKLADDLALVQIALHANTDALRASSAATKFSAAKIHDIISADQKARGITHGGISTSIDPRLRFLALNKAGSKDAAVANALALGFERHVTPLFRKTDQIPRAIKALQQDQHQLLAHGDTKNAAIIGGDIVRLQAELSRRLAVAARRAAQTTQAIKDKALAVSITNKNYLTVNGRTFRASADRYVSVFNNTLHGEA